MDFIREHTSLSFEDSKSAVNIMLDPDSSAYKALVEKIVLEEGKRCWLMTLMFLMHH